MSLQKSDQALGTPESAVPMLKVMRIQSPELANTAVPSQTAPVLSSALILPDSFGIIHIGETFTAYLGALNVSSSAIVKNLSISAILQTPTRKFPMPSILENKPPTTHQERKLYQPLQVEPHQVMDAIISRPLEETGQHILRVEVSYGGPDLRHAPFKLDEKMNGNTNTNTNNPENDNPRKLLRKFYRFHVSSPLHIRELTLRGGESTCFVSLAVENASPIENGSASGLTISQNDFQPYNGLSAQKVNVSSSKTQSQKSAVDLYDEAGRLDPGESKRYIFEVKAASENAVLRGIASGDELGKAIVTWHKAMGEAGRIASTFVYCPPSAVDDESEENNEDSRFVVQGSGLSVDVSASAADRSAAHSPSEIPKVKPLDDRFPVTVEPISPPGSMVVGEPVDVQVLIVNHSGKAMNVQLQMRLTLMKGVVVYGQSFKNLGEIQPNGGSVVSNVCLIAMVPGLFCVGGCYIVDLNTGIEIQQPNLLSVLVEAGEVDDDYDDDYGNTKI